MIYVVGGLGGGIGIGNTMTSLKLMKQNTPVDKVHHWVVGMIISLTGIITGFIKKFRNLSPFLTSLGLGIMLTDFPHLAKQLDNYWDGDPLDQGIVSDEEGWVSNGNDIIDVP